MIVRRGYKQAARVLLRPCCQLANGFIYDVITRGFGAMPDYAAQIPPRDRWAIVAYVRALQASETPPSTMCRPRSVPKWRPRNDGADTRFSNFG
jgi:hypothetical protein